MYRAFLLMASAILCAQTNPAPSPDQITILFDAFSDKSEFTPDWGYAALVEFGGKRILFDTGNNAAVFEANAKRLHVDLTRLDLVVISHRHGDHTSGLRYVLSINPKVPVYAPADESFLDTTPAAFLTKGADPSLPPKMRYFGGKIPSSPPPHGTAWPGIHIRNVDSVHDIAPNIHLISTVSELPGFRDLPELSLILDTNRGPVVIVGCSHPGIEKILSNVTQRLHKPEIYEVIGGMHLLLSPPEHVDHVISELVDRYHVQRVAPGHCTGERVFAALAKRFGKDYLYAGLAEVLPL